MKYIAIPMCLSGLICSVAVAKTLYYEKDGDCIGYYDNIPNANAQQCNIVDRVWVTEYYPTIVKYKNATGDETDGVPQTLPAIIRTVADKPTSGLIVNNENTMAQNATTEAYFRRPKLCYPGYGYKVEEKDWTDNAGYTSKKAFGFHCEYGVEQDSSTYHTIILKDNSGSQTLATLGYAIVDVKDANISSRLIWNTATNEILPSDYLPNDLVPTRSGYTLRGFTNRANVADVTESVSDNWDDTWFGTRYYTSFDPVSSEEYRRLFTSGDTISADSGDITLYATWYSDCTSDTCEVYATGFYGGVGYLTTGCPDGQVLTSGAGTYDPVCSNVYKIAYLCESGGQWQYQTVTPGTSVALPDHSNCTLASNSNYTFAGWQFGSTLLNNATTFATSDFYYDCPGGGKCLSLRGKWNGADSIETATTRADCESAGVGGKWCANRVTDLFTNDLTGGGFSCVTPTQAISDQMCCYSDRTYCNVYQCRATDLNGSWEPSNVNAANLYPENFCSTTSNETAVNFATEPWPFHRGVLSSYNVRPSAGVKKNSELNQARYWVNDSWIGKGSNTDVAGTSWSTGRHAVTQLDWVPTYLNSALYPGFKFGGWYTAKNCAGTKCIDENGNILANSSCTGTMHECWQESNTTSPATPGNNAIAVYFGTCDQLLRCGNFTNVADDDPLLQKNANGTHLWYGPLYVRDEQSANSITLYRDSNLQTVASMPRISGAGWFTLLLPNGNGYSDVAFPDTGNPGQDFRQFAFNPTNISQSSGLSGHGHYLMVHPGFRSKSTANKVTISCGDGDRVDSNVCNSLWEAYAGNPEPGTYDDDYDGLQPMPGGVETSFVNQSQNYAKVPSNFYVGPVKRTPSSYDYNVPCQCIKDGKFPCGWKVNNTNTVLKTNVYYNNLNTVTSLTAVYECN